MWTVDPSLFPHRPNYEAVFSIKLGQATSETFGKPADAPSALLVDFDNVWLGLKGTGVKDATAKRVAVALRAIASRFGPIAAAEAFASDFGSIPSAAESFRDLAYKTVLSNRPDLRMIEDGSSLLSGHPDIQTYVLVSGDSDLVGLARSILVKQKTVIVVAPSAVASKALKSIAHEFIPLEEFFSEEKITGLAPLGPVSVPPRPRLRVFLCHSKVDKDTVRELYSRLGSEGFIEPWFDEEDIVPGQNWQREIASAVRKSHCVLVCLSKRAFDRSGYVNKEIGFALDAADQQPDGTIFLIPARLDECDVPERLSPYQWVNLFESKGYASLLRALKARYEGLS